MDFPSLLTSSERRRLKRHDTRWVAHLSMGNNSFAVTIANYSASGLLLTFDQRAHDVQLCDRVGRTACIDASPSALAEVRGGLDHDEHFGILDSIKARVVHVTPLGLGIQVETFPHGWIAALDCAARRPVTDVRDTDPAYDPLLKRRVSVYASFSRKLASEVLARTADKLGALEGSDLFAASREHFEAARVALAERSARIIERFVADSNQRVTAEPGDDDFRAAASDVELSPQSARMLCAQMGAVVLAKFPSLF